MTFLYTALLSAAGTAWAVEPLRMVQPSPSQKFITPTDAIVFDIDSSVSDDSIGQLFLEFDGEDVTPSVLLDGRRASFQPPYRLSVGDHTVKLYEHMGNEQYQEIGRTTVRVAGTPQDDSQIWGEVSGQYNLMAAERVRDGYRHGDTHSGSAYVYGNSVTGGSNWDVSVRVNGDVDTVLDNHYDNEFAQLGEYLITGRAFAEDGNAMLRIGNHDAGISNLLIDRFYRRGASLQLEALDSLRMIGFSQDPARAIGDSNISGMQEDRQRVDGMYMQFYPIGMQENFWLESAYMRGEGFEKDRADADIDNLRTSGHGWQLGSQWLGFDSRTMLRGEFAHTTYDYDGSGTLLNAFDDHAWMGLAGFSLIGDMDPHTYNPTNWKISFEQKRIGSYFHSMTNTSLPSDIDRFGITSDFTDEMLSIVADGYRMTNNVNHMVDVPTDLTQGASVQASVTPSYFGAETEGFEWFNYSTLTAGASTTRTSRDETPAGFTGNNLSYSNASANAGWNVAYENATYNLSHTYTQYRDAIFPEFDQDSNLTELSATYVPSATLVISPSLQHERLRSASANERSNFYAGMDVSSVLIENTLSNHTYGSMQINASGKDDQQYNAATEFFWTLEAAERNKPGYGLALNASYMNIAAKGVTQRFDKGSEYRVYASLKINAPFGW